jgi:uncharacterized protein involved in exopolysaccharide biosynthesis
MTATEEPRTAPDTATGEEISLAEIVGFFKRQWLTIAAGAVLAVAVTVVYLGLLVHPLFTSTATLVVVSPTFAPEPEGGELSLQGYQRLLDSGAVRAQTGHQLQEEQILEPGEPFRLQSQIFISRRQDTTALAPVLELGGYAKSPEKAAAVANTWAEVFIDMTEELATSATTASVEVLEGEYAEVMVSLEEKETELQALETDFQSELDRTANAWSRSLVAAKAKTADLVAEHQNATRVLMTDLLEARLGGEEQGNLRVTAPVQAKLRQLAAVRIQLAQTSPLMILEAKTSVIGRGAEAAASGPVVVVERATGEETVSDKLTFRSPGSVGVGRFEERTETVPEIDPNYGELAMRAAELELELRELVTDDWGPVAALTAELEQLQRQRLAQLEQLREERGVERAALERKRRRELDAISRRQRGKIAGLQRSITELEGLATGLVAGKSEALLSQVQEDTGAVRVAASAVPTGQRDSRQIRLMALLAAFAGGVLGFVVALFREFGAATSGRV